MKITRKVINFNKVNQTGGAGIPNTQSSSGIPKTPPVKLLQVQMNQVNQEIDRMKKELQEISEKIKQNL